MAATLVVLAIAFRMINSVVFDHRLIRGSESAFASSWQETAENRAFLMSRLHFCRIY